jgi:type IV secretory pathway VirB6-like protein
MFGLVQFTLGQGLIRLVKIGFIFWLMSPGGLAFVLNYIYEFFHFGTNYLINVMVAIGQGLPPSTATASVSAPFEVLDGVVRVIFSPRMFVTVIATLITEPYGPIMGMALGYAIFSFAMAMLKALKVYVLSLIVKALLFGLTPVFFVFLLFDRTKNLFQGWLNQLINFSLQPILLFAFLAFFAVMLESSARSILPDDEVHVCYVKHDNQATTMLDMHAWRFACIVDGTAEPYEGDYNAYGPLECPPGSALPTFPINVVNILIFLLLTHIASQMVSVVTTIATELSSSITALDRIGQRGDMDIGDIMRARGTRQPSARTARPSS